MKDVFKAINKLNWFIRINFYLIIVLGLIAYISFIISLFGFLAV